MKLDVARLCLDCEEIHEEQICPLCGSEAFAFLTRWVQPSTERRLERRPERALARQAAEQPVQRVPRTPEQIEAYRQLLEGKSTPPRRSGLLTKSVLGLAAFGLAGWAWRNTSRSPAPRPESATPPSDEAAR